MGSCSYGNEKIQTNVCDHVALRWPHVKCHLNLGRLKQSRGTFLLTDQRSQLSQGEMTS